MAYTPVEGATKLLGREVSRRMAYTVVEGLPKILGREVSPFLHHPLVDQESDGLVDVEGMPVRMGAAK